MIPTRWRPMTAADLPAVQAIADLVHVAHPERPEVFAERLRLSPDHCFVWIDADAGVLGYAISHPWHGPPPALDTLLGALPADPTALHVHDIALLPSARGHGASRDILALLLAQARGEGLAGVCLVAVNGTAPLWRSFGFRETAEASFAAVLASYGADAAAMRLDL